MGVDPMPISFYSVKVVFFPPYSFNLVSELADNMCLLLFKVCMILPSSLTVLDNVKLISVRWNPPK